VREARRLEVYVAEDRNAVERVWTVRRNIPEAFKVASPVHSTEDIVVPIARIPDVLPELERLAARYGMQIPCFGHAGDGNLHAKLIKDPAMDHDTWMTNKDACLRELYRFVQRARRQDQRRARHRPQAQEVPPRRHRPRRTRAHARHQARLGPPRHHEPGQDLRPAVADGA
jgi:FAD/FMN-containing dehydrogenase